VCTALKGQFSARSLAVDPAQFHTYGVEWRTGSLMFTVDGDAVDLVGQAPDYPMQLMLGVFDFPDRAVSATGEVPMPELVVSHVRGQPLD
jgi:hypothetical protein